jgi:hypothetical protein
VITLDVLVRRLRVVEKALAGSSPPGGVASKRVAAALTDVREVLDVKLLGRALQHLGEHQAGFPASSMAGASGKGGVSDRTGESVVAPFLVSVGGEVLERARYDDVMSETDDIDVLSERLVAGSLRLYVGRYQLAKQLERDAMDLRYLLLRWAREPDVRWCKHCSETNGRKSVVWAGKSRDLCRPCAEWRSTNKVLPHADLIGYVQDGRPGQIPRKLLNKHRVKVPRTRRRS